MEEDVPFSLEIKVSNESAIIIAVPAGHYLLLLLIGISFS